MTWHEKCLILQEANDKLKEANRAARKGLNQAADSFLDAVTERDALRARVERLTALLRKVRHPHTMNIVAGATPCIPDCLRCAIEKELGDG